MNDRGFTLVEVVAVMVILVGIFLISFPIFENMSKDSEDKKYTGMVSDLCTAGKTYMYSNMDEFPELSIVNGIIEVKISDLISYGNVDKNLINSKTNASVKYDTLKYTVLEDYSLNCEYIIDTGDSVE